jgi:seryl-tRNA synthetase
MRSGTDKKRSINIMFDIKLLRENPDKVRQKIKDKNIKVDIDNILKTDEKRRKLVQKLDELRAQQNAASKKIVKLQGSEKQTEISAMKGISEEIKKLSPEVNNIEEGLKKGLRLIPNLPLDKVPVGSDESQNVVVREVGAKREFSNFKPRDYMEISKKLDIIDTERASKVSGTRFGYIKREAVLLEFALVQLALKVLTKEGFIPVCPPVMLKKEAMEAMGYMARGEKEIYVTKEDNLYLTGTSEQSLGCMHMGEIFKEDDLPRRYMGFSTCFRREAGSYGKDTKGILRVHQFDKVEMFSFCHPDKSGEEHKLIVSLEEKLVQVLDIPYRVVQICTGDLGDPSADKFDIECWMPGQQIYRETHSASNCTDYQARALNVRFRNKEKRELNFVHTLNGTAFAIGRILIAIIENYQQEDGSVVIPEALKPYMGGVERILAIDN